MFKSKFQTLFLEGILIVALICLTSYSTASAEVLKQDTSLWINTSHHNSVTFKAGTNVTRRSDGSVSSGTLKQDTGLWINTSHNNSTAFQAGTVVQFS